jgi:hypothetical protein
MATNIPSYMYSLFASLIIGSILICTVSIETVSIRNNANQQQIQNIQHYVAAQALTLLSQTNIDGQNTTQFLDIPSTIGNQRFWIRLENDSQSAWVETSFDQNNTSTENISEVPAKIVAQGSFLSGSGRPFLTCHYTNQIAVLTLTQE